MQKKIAGLLLGLIVTIGASACSPAQYKTWLEAKGFDSSQFSDQQINDGAKIATWYWEQTFLQLAEQSKVNAVEAELHKYDHVLSDASLARLRQCESGGNYNIVSPGGFYRGAYQFAPSTWNSVASRHFPSYVGVDPAWAAPLVQDAMARALFLEMGRSPWPVCGRYL